MSVISGAQSGEFINVKVIGIKDYDLLVEKFYLIHNKKRPLRRERRGQLGKKLICTPLRSGIKPSRNVKALLALISLFPMCYN
jgi:hypothetical protein